MPWHKSEQGRQTQRRAEKAYRRRLMQLGRQAKALIEEERTRAARETEAMREAAWEALEAFRVFASSVPRPANPMLLHRLTLLQEEVERHLQALLR